MPLSEILFTLTESLSSAVSSLPDDASLAPPPDGISLLDIKNQLLLSYLHNLVFLVILKLRSLEPQSDTTSIELTSDETVLKALVSLRVYLERGVRPLESRLKYQLDKLLLAANDAESQEALPTNGARSQESTESARPEPPRSSASSSHNTSPPPPSTSRIADLSHRPNPSAFIRPIARATSPTSRSTSVYRPPQINPAVPPTSAKPQRKPRASHTLNEYVREELDELPIAQPSIGTGNGLRGKAAEREAERRDYEEGRLVRLPGEGKKAAKRRRDVGEGFGEDLILGGAGELDDLVKGAKKKPRVEGGERKIGEGGVKWVKRGLGRKRR